MAELVCCVFVFVFVLFVRFFGCLYVFLFFSYSIPLLSIMLCRNPFRLAVLT